MEFGGGKLNVRLFPVTHAVHVVATLKDLFEEVDRTKIIEFLSKIFSCSLRVDVLSTSSQF